ncbi:MAG: otopetrin domain-containing protein, partial [Fuerstiella sp.]|nr:otopetrin domain-containing protein [Fuerstiella sp.]
MSSKDGRRNSKQSDPEAVGRILLVIFFGFIFCLILFVLVVILFLTLNDASGFGAAKRQSRAADEWVDNLAIIAMLIALGVSGYVVVDKLKFRRFNPGELVRLQSLAEADRPEMSSDSLVYRFNKKIGLGKTG